MTVSEMIRSTRLDRNFTQKELAARAEVSKRTIEGLENDSPVSNRTLYNVCTALGINLYSVINSKSFRK